MFLANHFLMNCVLNALGPFIVSTSQDSRISFAPQLMIACLFQNRSCFLVSISKPS